MAEDQDIVIVGGDGTEHHFPAGMDPQKAAAVVREHEAATKPRLIDANEPDTYMGGALKGLKEGVVGGATGFVKGIVPGAYAGAKEILKSPYTLAKGVVDAGVGGYRLATDFKKTANESVDAMAAMPGKVKDAVVGELRKAAVDPEGFGNDVGRLTGTAEAGIIGAHVVPLAPKPIARVAGKAVENFGKGTGFAMQISGAHQLMQGNPMGAIPIILPRVIERTGQKLQQFGEDPVAAAQTTNAGLGTRDIDVGNLKGPTIQAVPRGTPYRPARGTPYPATEPAPYRASAKAAVKVDEQAALAAQAEQENATRLAAIEAAKGDRVAGEPVIRESTVATQPGGVKASMSQTFKKAAAEADPNAPPPGWPPGVPYNPSKLGPIQPLRGSKVTTLGGGPATSIRVPGPSSAPVGKAASDILEGRVPMASHAPTPSDTRMNELTAKFAEGPKPARVATQDAIPASKSKGAMSATPGLTRADIEEVGGNPDVNYKNIPADMAEKIRANRASRHATHYANARTDKGLNSLLEQAVAALSQNRIE